MGLGVDVDVDMDGFDSSVAGVDADAVAVFISVDSFMVLFADDVEGNGESVVGVKDDCKGPVSLGLCQEVLLANVL